MTSELLRINEKISAEKDLKRFPVKSVACSYLWMHNLRATKQRLELFDLLSKENKPLSADDISKRLGLKSTVSTTYRMLEQFCKVGLASKVKNQNKAHALYEISSGRPHHHHATCTMCGAIEDVVDCDQREIDTAACLQLKKFKSIQSHSLEFFGLCKKCDNKSAEK